MRFTLSPDTAPHLPGLAELLPLFPGRFGPEGTPLSFLAEAGAPGFKVERSPEGITIRHARPCDAYRALAHLLAGLPDGEAATPFHSVGVMLDLSRNAVLRPDALERLFAQLALMGFNSVQLYMEDVYELPGEPFFGYGRGAYSAAELRRIDDAGHRLGIEVIPCIQTLGHLEQILQWPAYAELQDVPGVLLVGEEGTYRLVEKMLDTASACFRTRRIHVGMDEAHGVGTGRYREKHGQVRPFDVLNTHLTRVTALCVERGLRPMIWSDMYFRLGSKTNHYYDLETTIPQEVIDGISPEIEMVYWDYYHTDTAFYEEWIDRHRAMGKEPLLATGAWTWGRHWTALPHAIATNDAALQAARKKGLGEVFITAWGDDGAEFHPQSMLPALLYFAELAYTGEAPPERLEALYQTLYGSSFAIMALASGLNNPFIREGESFGSANYATWLLWHDPVFNFRDASLPEAGWFGRLAEALEPSACGDESLAFARLLAQTLEGKVRLHREARPAVERGDVAAVQALLSEVLPATLGHAEALWEAHRTVWHTWNKPFGWEVVERRYAQLVARLRTLGLILTRWVANPAEPVEEFGFTLQPASEGEEVPTRFFRSPKVITASYIK